MLVVNRGLVLVEQLEGGRGSHCSAHQLCHPSACIPVRVCSCNPSTWSCIPRVGSVELTNKKATRVERAKENIGSQFSLSLPSGFLTASPTRLAEKCCNERRDVDSKTPGCTFSGGSVVADLPESPVDSLNDEQATSSWYPTWHPFLDKIRILLNAECGDRSCLVGDAVTPWSTDGSSSFAVYRAIV